jgi:hypothetical protein
MLSDEEQLRAAVAGMPIDDGPRRIHREELRRRALNAFDDAALGDSQRTDSGRLNRLGRLIMRHRILQIGTAAAAACVILGIVWTFGPGAGVAFARVQEIIGQVQTVCYDLIDYHDGQAEPAAKISFMEPGRMRGEWPGMTAIFDFNQGKILTLTEENKFAHLATVKDLENPSQRNWLAALKSVVNCPAATELGQKQLSGRQAKGWEVPDDGGTCAVWVDATSGELLQVEFTRGRNRTVMTNFVVNPVLDESLFAMAPPPGYTLQTQFEMSQADPGEADIILLLRIWASGNGGVFPDTLLAAGGFASAAAKAHCPELGPYSKENDEKIRIAVGRAFFLLYSHKLEWGYVGKGVKAGDPGKPVLWTRAAGATNYRVILADFTVVEVSPDKLREWIPGMAAGSQDTAH